MSKIAIQVNFTAKEDIEPCRPVCIIEGQAANMKGSHPFIGLTSLACKAGGAANLAELHAGFAYPLFIDDDSQFDNTIDISQNRIGLNYISDDEPMKVAIGFSLTPYTLLPFIPIHYDDFSKIATCIYAP